MEHLLTDKTVDPALPNGSVRLWPKEGPAEECPTGWYERHYFMEGGQTRTPDVRIRVLTADDTSPMRDNRDQACPMCLSHTLHSVNLCNSFGDLKWDTLF